MTDIATQINKPNLTTQGTQKSYDFSDGEQSKGTDFDAILRNISIEYEEKVQSTSDTNNTQNISASCDAANTDEVTIEEYLQIVPRQIAIDIRIQNDLSLLALDENIPIADGNEAQDTCKLAELDFFCTPTQLSYEDYAQGEESNEEGGGLPTQRQEDRISEMGKDWEDHNGQMIESQHQ